jgi:hypothetical protein
MGVLPNLSQRLYLKASAGSSTVRAIEEQGLDLARLGSFAPDFLLHRIHVIAVPGKNKEIVREPV